MIFEKIASVAGVRVVLGSDHGLLEACLERPPLNCQGIEVQARQSEQIFSRLIVTAVTISYVFSCATLFDIELTIRIIF